MRAVIPAAGLGTRMYSVTHGGAKELLPLGESTVIEHVMAQAFEVCDQAVVIWDFNKGDLPLGVGWVPQLPQRGLAPAIASGLSTQDENLVLLPDAVFLPSDPLRKLATMGEGDVVLALQQVLDEETNRYGICEVDDNGWVTSVLEKPSPFETESRWAIAGRYRISPKAAQILVDLMSNLPADSSETDLSPFFQAVLDSGLKIAACFLDDTYHRFDCGDPEGYYEAVEAFKK